MPWVICSRSSWHRANGEHTATAVKRVRGPHPGSGSRWTPARGSWMSAAKPDRVCCLGKMLTREYQRDQPETVRRAGMHMTGVSRRLREICLSVNGATPQAGGLDGLMGERKDSRGAGLFLLCSLGAQHQRPIPPSLSTTVARSL